MTSARLKNLFAGALAALCISMVAGCRQDMADQPKYLPLDPSTFFADGRSERPLEAHTVPRGAIADDPLIISKDSNNFPLPVNMQLLERGQDRYKIFCTPCHGLQGDGNGMVVMRGMKRPPSYHIDRLRNAPVGYFFDVVTNGFGVMPSYSSQIPVRDRWAIIAYIRALQLSRNAKVTELPPSVQQKLMSEGSQK
jgi:hypothetical protein